MGVGVGFGLRTGLGVSPMDHSLWTGEQAASAQPETKGTRISLSVLQRQMGTVLLLGTPLQPHAFPNVLLAATGIRLLSSQPPSVPAGSWSGCLCRGTPPGSQCSLRSRSGPLGLLPGLRSMLCSGVYCGIVCALLRAGLHWANPKAVECFWIKWSPALAVG